MSLSIKQKYVLRNIIIGIITTVGLLFFAITFDPFGYNSNFTFVDRINVAMKSFLVIGLFLGFSIGRLSMYRFFSSEDIDGSGLTLSSSRAKILQSELQNTFEQSVLAVLTYFIWSVYMPSEFLSMVPFAALMFSVGRILFLIGYEKGGGARALGFALTFYPTIMMLFCCLILYLYELFGFLLLT